MAGRGCYNSQYKTGKDGPLTDGRPSEMVLPSNTAAPTPVHPHYKEEVRDANENPGSGARHQLLFNCSLLTEL